MKGFNVKKLAAIATGAALLGTALAPIVSATSVTKDDIYNSNGSPVVNIVVGSQAQVSDAVWAGNLAAKIAEKAATTKTVTASLGGADSNVTSSLDLDDLTVDVTIGGTVTYGAGSKKYNVNLNSGSSHGDFEVLTAMDGGSDTNALTEAQLPHLYNSSLSQKVNEGDQSNQTTSVTIKESIGLDVDVKFDSQQGTKDLVAKIDSGDFSYKVTLGSSSAGVDLGTTSFVDDADDSVKVVFFGEQYDLSTATLTGNKSIKLVKASAKESYNEGESIEGLLGDKTYDGEAVSVKVVQIVQSGAAASTYSGTFELYDSEGNLIDTQTVAQATNLRDVFKDSSSKEALKSNLYIDTIAVGSTTGVGYVEVTKGTDTIEILDSKIYPYDSTYTSGTKPYVAYLSTATDTNSLYSIEIRSSAEKWSSASGDSYDRGPLYPTGSGQSLAGKTATQAEFGQYWPDGTLGKGYAKVEFVGFESKEEKTKIEFGRNVTGLPSSSQGGVSFYADNDALRQIPFYIKLSDTNAGGNFSFEGKDIWFSMRSNNDTAFDYNLTVNSGDYINGRQWTLGSSDSNGVQRSLAIEGIATIGAVDGNRFFVDGVTYKIEDANTATTAAQPPMIVSVDTVVEFRFNNDTGTQIYNVEGDSTDSAYGLMALTDNIVFDGNQIATGASGVTPNLGLNPNETYKQDGSSESKRPVYYAAKHTTSTDKLFLLLDADKFGSGSSNKIQNNHEVWFVGTSVPADDGTYTEVYGMDLNFAGSGIGDLTTAVTAGSADGNYQLPLAGVADNYGQIRKSGSVWHYGHYVPKDTDYNSSNMYTSSNAYFVAQFVVNDAVSNGDANVYIDTATGGNLGPFGGSNTNLTGFSYDVEYGGTPTWQLTSGTQTSYLSSAYTDAGARADLIADDKGVTYSAPQAAEKVDIIVSGTEVTRSVSGGEKLTLKIGEEGTSASGTKITLSNPTGGSCSLSGTGGTAACTANPSSYTAQVPINKTLVYLDTDNPTGTNIVIGGHIVNRLASSLADRLTAPGNKVVEVDSASGDIFVAGYTAADTAAAVQELIDDIDAW